MTSSDGVMQQNVFAGFKSDILCYCSVIDHRRRHCVRRTKSHGARLCLVPYFFVLARHDVMCDLLQ